MLVHNVFFWLKKELSAEEREAFYQGLGTLSEIEYVRSFAAGVPAATDRPVVDNSYDYAIMALLDDMQAHDDYQVAPIHKNFLNNFSTYWEKVLVYDFETG